MEKKITVSRRDFVKFGGLATGGAIGALVGYPAFSSHQAEAAEKLLPAPVMGHIVCDTALCAGCRTCEAVCSLYREGIVNPELSRIQVASDARRVLKHVSPVPSALGSIKKKQSALNAIFAAVIPCVSNTAPWALFHSFQGRRENKWQNNTDGSARF